MSSFLENYETYKQLQNKKSSELTDDETAALKELRNQWIEITDSVAIKNNLKAIKNGKGLWQNSGSVSKYIWNRYKPSEDGTNLLIYFTMSAIGNEGIYVSIGLNDNNPTSFEQQNKDKIYDFLEQQCKTITLEGFKRTNLGWGDRMFQIENNLENTNFAPLMKALNTVYNNTLDKFYKHETINSTVQKEQDMNQSPLNQILYGPPGTGKTHNSIIYALSIIEGKDVNVLNKQGNTKDGRAELKKRFDGFVDNGQIVFTTFHQSYGYEEFVEGIKPVFESDNIEYEIKDGVFKSLCKLASEKEGVNFDEKIEWLKSECDEAENKSLKIGNFTVTYRGKKTFRIQPDKSKHEEADYPASIANIEKIYKGGSKKEIYNPTYTLGILEYLYAHGLKKYTDIKNTDNKPYILIIDEINRGNISKIFGELITLIEPSKRIGANEELRVSLPYSGMGDDDKGFGVPQNLYIIGTMNTADRSIALMDTALRRRFEFVEMMPDYTELNFEIDSINIGEMLKKINERIEYLYDRDHQIGHAYFMELKDTEQEKQFDKLCNTFKNKIIPLLQEYFYDDWEKIDLTLGGNGFIASKSIDKALFNNKEHELIDGDKKIFWLDKDALGKAENYAKIYQNIKGEQNADN